ncbi:MAG: DapH/DapD/GlmU-related protein [Chthoniobacterales bacterium]
MDDDALIEREERKSQEFRPWTAIPNAITPAQAAYHAVLREHRQVDLGEGSFVAESAFVDRGVKIGSHSAIAAGAVLRERVTLGDHCTVNAYTQIAGTVTIGSHVRIAAHVAIYGMNHGFEDLDRPICQQPLTYRGIRIEDDVWIGANAVVLDGVTIRAHSVIGAGSVVTRDVPAHSVVAGNPARVIRDRRAPRRSDRLALASQLTDFGVRVRTEWPAVLHAQTTSVAGERTFVDSQAGEPTVRAWCDAVEIAAMFDRVPPGHSREDLIRRLADCQDPTTGTFDSTPKRPFRARQNNYHFLAVGYALETLGSYLPHPVTALDDLTPDLLVAELETLPWATNAWIAGGQIDGIATATYHHRKYHRPDFDPSPLFTWLTNHAQPHTGLWGEPTAEDGWRLPTNGFYRITRGTYAQFDLPLPHPEATIDTLLAYVRQTDRFTRFEANACDLLDVIHPLWLCRKQTDHRAKEATQFVTRQIVGLLERWIPDRGFAFHPPGEPGLQGTEMGLSILCIAADYLGQLDALGFRPKGVHRLDPENPETSRQRATGTQRA